MGRLHGYGLLFGFLLTAFLLSRIPSVAVTSPPVWAAESTPNTTPLTPTLYLPLIQRPAPRLLIAAAHIDSAISGEGDEALWFWNSGPGPAALAGWQITGNGRTVTFPITSTLTIAPGAGLWCTADPTLFRRTFGFPAGCEWGADNDPAVPDLVGSSPQLTNSGGVVQLRLPDGQVADVLVYGSTSQIPPGWDGAAAQLYNRGATGAEGQVWRRKPDPQHTFADTDRAADWSGDLTDPDWGRQVFFPGWAIWRTDWKPTAQPIQASGTITLAVGPNGLYEPMAAFLRGAQESLDISLYTLEHPLLAEEIAAAARRGVAVRLLLEGGPTGGISHLQRWCTALIAEAGGQLFYLDSRTDAPNGFRPRYRFFHAKYGIADGTRSFVGTENLTPDSMPVPVESGVLAGRRGLYLFSDAPQISDALAAIFAYDWQPELFWDLRPFDPAKDAPPPDYTPPLPTGDPSSAPHYPPAVYSGDFAFHLLAAPENATRPDNPLTGLLAQAGSGDEIRWLQLYEHKYWGDTYSNPVADPNPRLAGLIAAAQRGARVRLLLDSYFDDPNADRSNRATVDYLRLAAQSHGVDMQAIAGNPAGAGIHAKAGALAVGNARWVLVGSLNGGEVSHKINREVSLLVNAPPLYDRLVELFDADWVQGPGQ